VRFINFRIIDTGSVYQAKGTAMRFVAMMGTWTRGAGRRHAISLKAKFHYAILVADRSEDGRRHAASWNLAYHLAR